MLLLNSRIAVVRFFDNVNKSTLNIPLSWLKSGSVIKEKSHHHDYKQTMWVKCPNKCISELVHSVGLLFFMFGYLLTYTDYGVNISHCVKPSGEV